MPIDPITAIVFLRIVAEGVGVAKSIRDLAIRIQQGEVITDEEIKKEQAKVDASVGEWDKAVNAKPPTLIHNEDDSNGG